MNTEQKELSELDQDENRFLEVIQSVVQLNNAIDKLNKSIVEGFEQLSKLRIVLEQEQEMRKVLSKVRNELIDERDSLLNKYGIQQKQFAGSLKQYGKTR